MPKTPKPDQIGMIPWYSYFADDQARGREFYQKLFNWKVETFASGGHEGAMFSADGHSFADLSKPEGGGGARWDAYAVVEDVATTLRRAEQMGGRTLRAPLTLPTIGTMGRFQDPAGAAFWAYAPEDPARTSWAMGTAEGRVCWHELMTPDPEAAKAFYGEVFRWTIKRDDKMGMWFINAGEKTIGHVMKTPPQAASAPPAWFAYFMTASVEATTRKAVSLGAAMMMPKTEVPATGWFSFLRDPAGACFYLWEPRSSATKGAL